MSSSFGNKIARSLVSSKCDLRACKSVKFAFNPWQLETKSIRDVYTYLNSARMRESNDKCKLIADIRSDLMEPHIEIQFVDETTALFKTNKLTTLDIVRDFYKLSRMKAPKKEEATNN